MQDFARYLLAKRSVDDRALNRRVWGRLERELRESPEESIRIVDLGAGLATGAERIAEWQLVEPLSAIRYTGVEPRRELLEEAHLRLRSLPFPAELAGATLEEFAARDENRGRFDLVVAHALLDILELSPSLEALVGLARPGGLLYLPITFDGETLFEPGSSQDDAVLSAYHDTMEARGSSRTGRRLFHALRSIAAEVLEIGSSDWIVHPTRAGYPEDEAFFLEFILKTIEDAVRDRVERASLETWLSERRRQLASADLVYCAHQVDVLARRAS
ncbi:MAG TPA: class I SAM-dependent methyltransferase [Vicinamibacteria bacterium]|nr:class I SAM-dependent methyltransferase [Vicinamibacteria bacterium]